MVNASVSNVPSTSTSPDISRSVAVITAAEFIFLLLAFRCPPNVGEVSADTLVIPPEDIASQALALRYFSILLVSSYHRSPSEGLPGALEAILYSFAYLFTSAIDPATVVTFA